MRKVKAAEAKKAEAERLQGFLQEMLKEEENKYCADCEAKQPRWASWNIGVFLCIRCAGLHRNLGVHVSKVKSVTLDSWTPDQIQSMRVMGNAKARAVYECELPSMFRRPQTDQSLEAYIRAKYETKRYIMKDWVPPRVDAADLPPLAANSTKKWAAPLVTTLQPNTSDKDDDSLFGPFSTASAPPPADHHHHHSDIAASSDQSHHQQLVDVFAQPDQKSAVGIGELFAANNAQHQQQMPGPTNATSPEGKTQNVLELIDFSSVSSLPIQQQQQHEVQPHQQQLFMMASAPTTTAFQQQPTKADGNGDAKLSTNEILALFGTKR